MKVTSKVKNLSLVLAVGLFFSLSVFAQEATPTPQKRDRITGNPKAEVKPTPVQTAKTDIPTTDSTAGDKQIPDTAKQDVPNSEKTPELTPPNATDKQDTANQTTPDSSPDETAEVVSYYVNYVREYRLGPEDVISVEVFGQPNYSKAGITVPPTATISYPLIPGGIFVSGKSTEQVAKEITKKLSEYIIDPQVTVTLEKVGSARYAVMGDVAQPGIRLMTRRVTAISALTEAGGVLSTGSKSKVAIYRNGANGFTPITVDVDAIMKGKAKDIDIQPGDQIVVPGNKMKKVLGVLDVVSKLSAFRLLFGSPF